MHINNWSDETLKSALEDLLSIIPSYQHHYFYNRSLVDPYLLASHGLVVSHKRTTSGVSSLVAACKDPHCDLTIAFDEGV